METAKPIDKYWLCYQIFFLMGLGMLFPWNAFITAQSYFKKRVCDTPYESYFMNVFTISFTVCNLIGLVGCIKYQHLFSIRRRCDVPLLIQVLVFGTTTFLVLDETINPDLFFVLTAVFCCVSGLCCAILQGGIFGIAGLLPPMYTQGIMSGQGFAGITVALSSLVTAWTSTSSGTDVCDEPYENVKWSAFAYFAFSCAILLLCILGFYVMESLEFYRYWVEGRRTDQLTETLLPGPGDNNSNSSINKARLQSIFWEIKDLALCVCLVFTVTLFVFPATTTQVQAANPSDSIFFGKLWIPMGFVLFNGFDFAGRCAAGCIKYTGSPRSVWVPTLLRLSFAVIFLLCNTGSSSDIPNLLNSDWIYILNMCLFALTNGYISSVLMMMGPQSVAQENMEVAGTVMVFFLTLGLFAGSLLSLGLLPFVK